MKIKSIKKIELDQEIPVYDVVDATPYHNFLIKTPTSSIVSHNCGLLDEVDFVKGASVRMEQSKVMKLYNGVKRRMESRYMRHGELPGVLFLVSSKKSEHDFLEQYAKTQENNENVLIVDEPLWKVKPASNYSGKVFYVAVGNKYVKSKIIGPTEDLEAYRKQNYRILEVPVEHKNPFIVDIDSALMDIAGISTSNTTKFISYDRLKKNYSTRINPFHSEVLSIGHDDDLQIKDFFVPDLISQGTRAKPGFIHIDTSLTGDRTGISYVAIDGTKKVDQYNKNPETGEVTVVNNVDLVYRQIFTIGISAPSDSEISFEKTRQFIYYLRNNGFNIKGISCDGFQSRDTIQLLKNAGFKAELVSLDRTNTGYNVFKSAINEQRVDLLQLSDSLVEHEIIDLEQDGLSGKIDHPIEGCFTGDTEVLLSSGETATLIDLIKDYKDKKVFTYNHLNDNIINQHIKKVFFTKTVTKLAHVHFEDDSIIKCTTDHRFLLNSGIYKKASELEQDDYVKNINGCTKVEKVDILLNIDPTDVYDLEVLNFHNFALGNGVIVHNSKDLSDSLCGSVYLASMYKLADNIKHATQDAEATVKNLVKDTFDINNDMTQELLGDYMRNNPQSRSIYSDEDIYDMLNDDGIIF